MRAGEVLILSDYAGDGGSASGGAGMAVLGNFRALQASGMRVRLVAGIDLAGGIATEEGITSLGGSDLRGGSSVSALRTMHNAGSKQALAGLLAHANPTTTIVILHQWTRYLTPAAIALLRPFPVMIYMHDYFWFCPTGAYFDFTRGEPCTRVPAGLSCVLAQCDRGGYIHKLVRLTRHAALKAATRGKLRQRYSFTFRKRPANLPSRYSRAVAMGSSTIPLRRRPYARRRLPSSYTMSAISGGSSLRKASGNCCRNFPPILCAACLLVTVP